MFSLHCVDYKVQLIAQSPVSVGRMSQVLSCYSIFISDSYSKPIYTDSWTNVRFLGVGTARDHLWTHGSLIA